MKKRLIGVMSVLLTAALTFFGCKKYTESTGPKYYTAPKDFTVANNEFFLDSLSFQNDKADFSQLKPHYFKAKFSSRVDWTLRIKGLRSGAYKIIRGSSDLLDSTNTQWRGGHSGTFFFKNNEKCVAEIEFLGSKMTLADSFDIVKAFNFNQKAEGVILITRTDFEAYLTKFNTDRKPNPTKSVFPANFPNQFGFLEGTKDPVTSPITYDGATPVLTVESDPNYGSVEGELFMRMAQIPNSNGKKQCDNTGYFAGAVQHRYFKGANNPANFLVTDWTDPNDLWINIYAYGDSYTMNSQVNVQLHEADGLNTSKKPSVYDFNKDTLSPIFCQARLTEGYQAATPLNPGRTTDKDKHDANLDDSWDFQFKPDVQGWKLYSMKLSDMTPGATSKGAKVREPNRIARVQVALISTAPFRFSAMAFDYVTLTKGGPFNPDKY